MSATEPFNTSLVIKDVHCERGGRSVFTALSLELSPGEAAMLVGANGSGKSSLLRMIAGLVPLRQGRISADITDVDYCGHHTGLKAGVTVELALRFYVRLLGGNYKDNAGQAANVLSLQPLMRLPIEYLSEGQKRRVALARMIVNGRPIWLMDEPNAGLDSAHLKGLEDMVKAHLENGGIAVIASHVDLDIPVKTVLDMAEFQPEEEA